MKPAFMFFICVGLLTVATVATAQPSPIVKMTVTLPDGKTQDVSVHESATGTVTLSDGTEIGLRPTILDSKPWTHVVVTFFKMPTPSHGIEEMGSVEVKTGSGAVQSKTNPVFKVAIPSVLEGVSATT